MVCEDEKSPFFDNAINGPSNNDSSFVSAIASKLKSQTSPFSQIKPTVKDIMAHNRSRQSQKVEANEVVKDFDPNSPEAQSVNEAPHNHTFGTP